MKSGSGASVSSFRERVEGSDLPAGDYTQEWSQRQAETGRYPGSGERELCTARLRFPGMRPFN